MVRLISGDASMSSISASGRSSTDPDADTQRVLQLRRPDFLRTLGIPLCRGREFTRADVDGRSQGRDCQRSIPARNSNSGATRSASACTRGPRNRRIRHRNRRRVARLGLRRGEREGAARWCSCRTARIRMSAYANFYVRTRGSEQDLLAAIPRLMRDIDPTLPVDEPSDDDRAGQRRTSRSIVSSR